jgi:hypothetical protein
MENKEKKSNLDGKSKSEIIQMIDEGMLYLSDSDLDAFYHKISTILIRRKRVHNETTHSKLDVLDKLDEIDDPVSAI